MIRDIPGHVAGVRPLLDAYEREHFGFDPGGRTVAEATLALLATFPPYRWLPAGLVRHISFATMDEPLLDAFAFPLPGPDAAGARPRRPQGARHAVRLLPPRREPFFARQLPQDLARIPTATTSAISARSRPAARCRTPGPV